MESGVSGLTWSVDSVRTVDSTTVNCSVIEILVWTLFMISVLLDSYMLMIEEKLYCHCHESHFKAMKQTLLVASFKKATNCYSVSSAGSGAVIPEECFVTALLPQLNWGLDTVLKGQTKYRFRIVKGTDEWKKRTQTTALETTTQQHRGSGVATAYTIRGRPSVCCPSPHQHEKCCLPKEGK